ncbi:hypothetical protein HID58_006254 [Brassica napus]|uniref:Uncharacterized protein n=1 Tax=Brassica napus TaxID=3708 RepID=A0ABQ8EBI1_BRANA|nr:hypothetical protein HID58_006254 [Brassica napus]
MLLMQQGKSLLLPLIFHSLVVSSAPGLQLPLHLPDFVTGDFLTKVGLSLLSSSFQGEGQTDDFFRKDYIILALKIKPNPCLKSNSLPKNYVVPSSLSGVVYSCSFVTHEMALSEDIHVSFLMGQNQRQLIYTEEKPQDCREVASAEKETNMGMLKIFWRYRLDQVTKKISCPYSIPNRIDMQVTLKRSGPPERRGAGRSRRTCLEWRRDVGEAEVRRVGF